MKVFCALNQMACNFNQDDESEKFNKMLKHYHVVMERVYLCDLHIQTFSLCISFD